nr:MAG TPA: hypothetical protein [Caudoviricetes sp.]
MVKLLDSPKSLSSLGRAKRLIAMLSRCLRITDLMLYRLVMLERLELNLT